MCRPQKSVMLICLKRTTAMVLWIALTSCFEYAQEKMGPDSPAADSVLGLSKRVAELSGLVQKLQARVDDLEEKLRSANLPAATALAPPKSTEPSQSEAKPAGDQQPRPGAAAELNVLRGTMVNFLLDGYYGYYRTSIIHSDGSIYSAGMM